MITLPTQTDLVTFAGDWHGYTGQALNVINHAYVANSDIIIQLGDFGIWEGDESFLEATNRRLIKRNTDLYFIDGNHENFPRLYEYPIDPATGLRPIRSNIFHLPRGFRFQIAGVRFLALGGAYSVDRNWRKLGKSWWREETLTDEDIKKALSPEDKTTDVLLTHDSPFPAPNPVTDDAYRQAQAQRIFGYKTIQAAKAHRAFMTPVFIQSKPRLLLHGHYHEYGVGHYRHSDDTLTTVLSLHEGTAPVQKHAVALNMTELRKEIDNDLPE
jgi:predicted phosphodiesterase